MGRSSESNQMDQIKWDAAHFGINELRLIIIILEIRHESNATGRELPLTE